MRPRWVETAAGRLGILIAVEGRSALLREARARGGYFWCAIADLRRRPELDASPDPAWLARARASRRPSPRLYALLGLAPAPPDTLDVTEPNDGPPAHEFD